LIYKTGKLEATNTFGTTFDQVHYTYPTSLTYCIGAGDGWGNCTGSCGEITIFL